MYRRFFFFILLLVSVLPLFAHGNTTYSSDAYTIYSSDSYKIFSFDGYTTYSSNDYKTYSSDDYAYFSSEAYEVFNSDSYEVFGTDVYCVYVDHIAIDDFDAAKVALNDGTTLNLGKIFRNLSIGSGVILVTSIVLPMVFPGAAPATAVLITKLTSEALVAAATEAATKAVITYVKTGDAQKTLYTSLEGVSDGFMWGAIFASGAETIKTVRTARKSLNLADDVKSTMDYNKKLVDELSDAKKIKNAKKHWSSEVSKYMKSDQEAYIYRRARLKEGNLIVNGKKTKSLMRTDINWNLKDEFGRTNLQRMKQGYAPLVKVGDKLETVQLHHIGQHSYSPLAEITHTEHGSSGIYQILHDTAKIESEIDRQLFAAERAAHWKSRAAQVESAL